VLRSGNSTIIARISRDIRARLAIEEKWPTWRSSTRSPGAEPQPVPGPPGAGDGAGEAQRVADGVLFIASTGSSCERHARPPRGDKLLKEAAERLRSCIRGSDTVGRWRRRVRRHPHRPRDTVERGLVAQKIIDVLRQPFDLDARRPTSRRASASRCTRRTATAPRPRHERRRGDVPRQGAGAQQLPVLHPRHERARAAARAPRAALRRALDRNEYRLVYQPKAQLATGKICGFEALLRWDSDQGRWRPPSSSRCSRRPG